MADKYDSTEFWYTFINSLYNEGLSYGIGELEMDEEMQDKFLAYLKEKIDEDVTNGETALPPGLHNYYWRIPKEMLPKTRELTDSFLQSDPQNGTASLLRTIVEISDWDANNDPQVDESMALVPNDPCMNLVVIDKYRKSQYFNVEFERHEKVVRSLENLYTWAKQQEDTARYQEARSFYLQHRVTPYTVYKQLKDRLRDLQNSSGSDKSSTEIEICNSLIKKCRDLVPMEKAAFRKYTGQQSEDQQDLVDEISDHTDIWDAFLKSLENRKNAPPRRLTEKDQEQLLDYLEATIAAGVVDGRTILPTDLHEHISEFPEVMHLELREFAEEVLETQPKNGAAMKILASIVWEGKRIRNVNSDSDLIFLEQSMMLAPKDAETCFYALRHYDKHYDPLFKLTLTALERMFERAEHKDEAKLTSWMSKLYRNVGRTPCHIYRNLMKNPEANAELIERCQTLIEQMQHAFKHQLNVEPDDWYALRGLGDVYEVLGETVLAQEYPWEPHPEYRWDQAAWVGKQIPNFSTVAIDGTPISVSDYRGKMLVLNFCAKWCGFCDSEIPYLKQVYEEHHHNGLEVIGVSLDENEKELSEYIEEHEIPWHHIFDGKGWKSELAQFFSIYIVPSQWLIDRDGTILSVHTRGEHLGQLVKWTETTRIGNVIPDFTAVDIDGNSISAAAFRGKVVLVHFGYINREPELALIDTLYKKHHNNGFEVIGFNIGGWRDEEALHKVVRKENHKGHYVYADEDGLQCSLVEQSGFGSSSGFRKVKLPAFILIDADGKVIDARYEKVHSLEAWAVRIDELVSAHI